MNVEEWAIVERFGRAGETASDVVARITAEGFMSPVDDSMKVVRVARTRIDGLSTDDRRKCESKLIRK